MLRKKVNSRFNRLRFITVILACIFVLVAISKFVLLNNKKESTVSVGHLQELFSKPTPESIQLAPDLEKSIIERLIKGQRTFRYDTFGDEAFWGDTLNLHRAIAGEGLGGVGPGVSPQEALAIGLKVDI